MDKAGRRIRKIVAASAVLFVNIATSVVGVVAWFQSIDKVELQAGTFSIENKSVQLNGVKLIKFDYKQDSVGAFITYDYLTPGDGKVNTYRYNDTTKSYGFNATFRGLESTGQNACTVINDCYKTTVRTDDGDKDYLYVLDSVSPRHFYNAGEYKNVATPATGSPIWVKVDMMNLYDPAEMIIYEDISRLNCNAIYELEIGLNNMGSVTFDLDAIRKGPEQDLGDKEILLSSCVDFDVFTLDELDDDYKIRNNYVYGEQTTIEGVTKRTGYYPSYKKTTVGETQTVTSFLTNEDEEIYYKISHLSAHYRSESHSNFYSLENQNATECRIETAKRVTGEGQTVKIYVNVNYADSQLEKYSKDIGISNIKAKYDFMFKFKFDDYVEQGEGQ